MKRPILIHPDPRLKKLCTPVADLSDDLRALADDMLETMYAAPGIGLAAPQVGVMDRLIVMDCEKDETQPPKPMVMFNPEIIDTSEDLNVYEEGCLSIPEQYAEVERPESIRVRYLDRSGEEQELDATGMLATCIQHEMDHLDGILFVDLISSLKRNMILRKLSKAKKMAAAPA